MFRSSRRISDLETRVAALALAVAELRERRDASSNENILKLVENLQTDIDLCRASVRSAHGKIDVQKRGLEPGQTRAAADVSDGELDAWLALQLPAPQRNGSSN